MHISEKKSFQKHILLSFAFFILRYVCIRNRLIWITKKMSAENAVNLGWIMGYGEMGYGYGEGVETTRKWQNL